MSTPTSQLDLHVSFWGTRGSISTPGRATEKYGGNTPCVSVQHKDTLIVLDACTGIRNLGLSLTEALKAGTIKMPIHLFLSHTHWDHIQGLPFFGPAYTPGVKLDVYGSARKGGFLESILQGQMDYDYFPVDMNAFGAELTVHEMTDKSIDIGPLHIEWQEQVFHPGGCVRYSITVNGRKVVYASDVELNKIFRPAEPSDELAELGKQYMDFIRDAEILIADGQYTESEYAAVTGWGHTTIPLIVETAYAAGVKQLALFHHDPQRSDKMIDEFWKEWYPRYHDKSPPMNIFWAREGLTVPV